MASQRVIEVWNSNVGNLCSYNTDKTVNMGFLRGSNVSLTEVPYHMETFTSDKHCIPTRVSRELNICLNGGINTLWFQRRIIMGFYIYGRLAWDEYVTPR